VIRDLDLVAGPHDEVGELARCQSVARPGPVNRDDVAALGTGESMARRPRLDALRTGRADGQLPADKAQRDSIDDEPVPVALENSTPPDPARIDDLQDTLGRP